MNVRSAREALRRLPTTSATVLPFPAPSPTAPVPAPSLSPETSPAPAVSMPAGRWSRYAGKLGAALTVTVSAAAIRKGGHEPNEPDDSDVDLLQQALEEGLRDRFGEGPVPWWLGAAMAAGGVYAGMRVGAAKLAPPATALQNDDPRPTQTPLAPPRPAAFQMPPAVDGGGGL